MPYDTRPLQYGLYYHIYNRGVNRQNIFFEDRNYHFFLQLYGKYVDPIADTYAYCLLPNHFHLLVRVKTEQEQTEADLLVKPRVPSQQFSNLFNAYSKAVNNTYRRTGALFQRPFGRSIVAWESYFTRLVVYIHRNPQKHGLTTDFQLWPYTSYHSLVNSQFKSRLQDEMLTWFGGVDGIDVAHRREVVEQEVRAVVEAGED